MQNFTPFSALTGGMLIGLAATLLLLCNGKILGVSGILSRALRPSRESLWQIVFLLGLILGAFLYKSFFSHRISIVIDASIPTLIIAGLLVGFGTNLGSGCTSGHGICGLARFSPRSIAATITFMLSGILTVYFIRHWGGAG